MGRGNQYIHLVKVLYFKVPTIGKKLPTFPHRVRVLKWGPQRWESSVLPLHHHGSLIHAWKLVNKTQLIKVNTRYTFSFDKYFLCIYISRFFLSSIMICYLIIFLLGMTKKNIRCDFTDTHTPNRKKKKTINPMEI